MPLYNHITSHVLLREKGLWAAQNTHKTVKENRTPDLLPKPDKALPLSYDSTKGGGVGNTPKYTLMSKLLSSTTMNKDFYGCGCIHPNAPGQIRTAGLCLRRAVSYPLDDGCLFVFKNEGGVWGASGSPRMRLIRRIKRQNPVFFPL